MTAYRPLASVLPGDVVATSDGQLHCVVEVFPDGFRFGTWGAATFDGEGALRGSPVDVRPATPDELLRWHSRRAAA